VKALHSAESASKAARATLRDHAEVIAARENELAARETAAAAQAEALAAAEAAAAAKAEELAKLDAQLVDRAAEIAAAGTAIGVREARVAAAEDAANLPSPQGPALSYENCDAARAAGAAPVHIGEPGYGKHLDADGDGVGCERRHP